MKNIKMTTNVLSICSMFIMTLATAAPSADSISACDANSLAVYNVTFTGLWSKEVFPKQYPLFRPPAQWTKVLGRSHEEGYNIFSINNTASEGLTEFVQTGVTRIFDLETQGQSGILDIFTTAAVSHGVGQADATFFVDGIRSKVSMIAKIVPSPDWFVGVDSLDMCQGGEWQDHVTIDLDPMDAGTDQGYTFTSPNWADKPQKPISLISAHFPNHPANSFYYPEKDVLPTLAKLEFVKVRTYRWKDGARPEAAAAPSDDVPSAEQPSQDASQDVQNDEEATGRLLKGRMDRIQQTEQRTSTVVEETTTPVTMATTKTLRNLTTGNNERRRGRRKDRKGRRGRKNRRRPVPKEVINALEIADQMVDCEVTEWSEWGACSKTCGFGNRARQRTIVRKPENFGHPCPLLLEDTWCGSMRNCGWTHFQGINSRYGNQPNRTTQRRVFRFGQGTK